MRTKTRGILTLLLAFVVHLSYAQDKAVSGTVTDQTGIPLPGVNIIVKGTINGTQTDFDGNYAIQAAEGQLLVFSYIGQKEVSQTVGTSTTINVQMEESAEQLGEVIVTGALDIKRSARELVASVASLDTEDITKTRAVNVATAIVGKVSGLQINTVNSGVNPSTRVVLRGNRSLLGNNEALIVVDGFPSSRGVLDRISASDIENISVLKGANAGALYGSDATNGVIVVTTKSGKGPLSVTYNTSYQMETVAYLPEFQEKFGAGGFPDGTLYPLENVNWGPRYDGRLVDASETLDDGRVLQVPFTPIKNRNRDFFNTGSTIRHGVTAGGGDDKGDYFMSIDQTNTTGTVPKDTYNQTNFRLKGSRTLDKLTVGGNLSFFRSHANTVGAGGRQNRPVYWNVINTPLHIPLNDPEWRNWRTGEFTRNEVSYYRFYENPWFIIDTQREKTDLAEFNILANAKYEFNDWISASIRSGYTGNSASFKREFGAFNYAFHLQDTYSELGEYGARTADNIAQFERFNTDVLLQFNRDITEDFTAKLILGQNIRHESSKFINVSGQDLIIPDFYNVSTRTGELQGGESSTLRRKFGSYADLTLSYKRYLNLNLTGRNDWSSTLPKGNQSFFYPSAGLSFIATDAFPSIKGDRGIGYLKLRASTTRTGNDPNIYQTQGTFFAPGNFPYGTTAGLSQSVQEPAPDLNPEFTTSTEAGFEMQLFRNRLKIEATVYKSNSTDQIVPINVSTSSGAVSNTINVGEIENKGIELDVSGTVFQNEDFKWDLGTNYSGFESEVISLIDGVDELDIGGFGDAQIIAKVGQPYPQIRTSAYLRDPQGRVIVGTDGDPLQDTKNQIQGKTTPDFTVGVYSNIVYKNWSLYAVADYRTGHVFFNDIVNALEFTGLTKHSASSDRQPFIWPNSVYEQSGTFVANTTRPTSGGGNAFWDKYNEVKENYVIDATTLKIRELALSYTFDDKTLDQIGLSNITLGLFGRNLFTFRPKDNVYTDPEFNFTTGNAIGVGTQAQLAPTRSYGVNLSIKF
ncbi:SusC/RagA family TonB-linked outer membrane protein [Maribacter sp. ACAM166]|uniref:SusC/RagA family TonB-linked outer membrane protein n=1 Tax=Maribacter sp. ACAM166 TaxID=2508996 RepID=UPI0010FD6CB7|nr:SusC/RagA family TonB-linked outer membrane protein [Maribacter sp. ACAM166]TLP75643.1 SusC/RagA family TonB-linked outer membrane protein [Maribacter sp. ACAM166]